MPPIKGRKPRRKQKSNIFLEIRDKSKSKMPSVRNFTFIYFIIALVGIIAINSYFFKSEVKTVPYSEFKELIGKGKISDLVIDAETIQGDLAQENGKKTKFLTSRVDDPDLVKDLQKTGIKYSGFYENKILKGIISWVLPFAIMFFIWNLLMRKMGERPRASSTSGRARGGSTVKMR